ncbi:MAG TPA: hypothetical protein DIV79_08770 [Opitutae bacterium]|nr:hypothetical protein [Opitutaceae bacterium]HCR30095.1 hypothetical protein [Opitutae bacterium]
MSGSKKKSPYASITSARSEKADKRLANRRDRRINTNKLRSRGDDENLVDRKSTSNVWTFDKDGKRRFDPSIEPKPLRK